MEIEKTIALLCSSSVEARELGKRAVAVFAQAGWCLFVRACTGLYAGLALGSVQWLCGVVQSLCGGLLVPVVRGRGERGQDKNTGV